MIAKAADAEGWEEVSGVTRTTQRCGRLGRLLSVRLIPSLPLAPSHSLLYRTIGRSKHSADTHTHTHTLRTRPCAHTHTQALCNDDEIVC